MATNNIRPEFKHLFAQPLTYAVCDQPKCKRGYWWAAVPKHCPWPGCPGRLAVRIAQ